LVYGIDNISIVCYSLRCMIFHRLRLGAQRTKLLVRLKSETTYRHLRSRLSAASRVPRVTATGLLALQMAIIPVPFPAGEGMAAEDGGPVPDPSREEELRASVLIAPQYTIVVAPDQPTLRPVTLGKSLATEREEAERQLAEAKRLEDERRRREEYARQQAARRLAEQRRVAAAQATAPAAQPGTPAPTASADGDVKGLAYRKTVERWGESEWAAMNALIMRESGYNPNAVNSRSGACGIPQAHPCSKLQDRSVEGQLNWMMNYVQRRYGTPSQALQFHNTHRWY
jgi:colicin import membrane protein